MAAYVQHLRRSAVPAAAYLLSSSSPPKSVPSSASYKPKTTSKRIPVAIPRLSSAGCDRLAGIISCRDILQEPNRQEMRGYASLTKCLPSGLPPGATRRFVAQSFSGCARNCCERAGIRPAGILRRPLRRSRTLSTAVAEHCFDIAEDIHPQPRVRTSNSTQQRNSTPTIGVCIESVCCG